MCGCSEVGHFDFFLLSFCETAGGFEERRGWDVDEDVHDFIHHGCLVDLASVVHILQIELLDQG